MDYQDSNVTNQSDSFPVNTMKKTGTLRLHPWSEKSNLLLWRTISLKVADLSFSRALLEF